MLLLDPPQHESLPSEVLDETVTGNRSLTVPRLNLGVASCVLFLLPLLAVGGLLLLNAVWPSLLADPLPHVPEPPGAVLLGATLLYLVVMTVPVILAVGVVWALLGLCQRGRKRWVALLGLCLHASVILAWFTGWPIRF
jgi:hypothetical protein